MRTSATANTSMLHQLKTCPAPRLLSCLCLSFQFASSHLLSGSLAHRQAADCIQTDPIVRTAIFSSGWIECVHRCRSVIKWPSYVCVWVLFPLSFFFPLATDKRKNGSDSFEHKCMLSVVVFCFPLSERDTTDSWVSFMVEKWKEKRETVVIRNWII